MGSIVGCFLPLLACIAPSGSMNSSSLGKGFGVRFSSGPLSPGSEMHCVFSNGDLASSSGRQPRARAIAFIMGGGYNRLSQQWSPLIDYPIPCGQP